MDALTLLIADSDEDFRHALTLALQDSFYIRTCQSGTRALELLRASAVHILAADLMLPELDGLTLLETLAREGICPEILVMGPDIPDLVYSAAEDLGIRCFLRKPCPLGTAVAKIQQLRRELEHIGLPQKRARQLLCQMHILPKLDGYDYLMYALPALVQDPKLTITKHLYSDTAKAYSCYTDCVEHSMRMAIETAWDNHYNHVWAALFPRHKERPSNGVFLQTLALEIRKNLE